MNFQILFFINQNPGIYFARYLKVQRVVFFSTIFVVVGTILFLIKIGFVYIYKECIIWGWLMNNNIYIFHARCALMRYTVQTYLETVEVQYAGCMCEAYLETVQVQMVFFGHLA